MTVKQQIKQELATICAINDANSIKDEAWLIEYGLDSLRSMELVMALEDYFQIELSDEAIGRLQTVGDVVTLIERQTAV